MSKWFSNKFSWLAIIIASFISLSFVFCALPAFKHMPTNTKNLPIVIVNQDNQQISNKVASGLKDNLPFKHLTISSNLSQTKHRIEVRKASLAVVIPAGFNKDVRAGKQLTLNFVVNNANSMLQTNVNQSLISRVQSTVNAQLTQQSLVGMYAKQLAPKMMKTAMQAGMKTAIKKAMVASKGQAVNQKKIRQQVQAQVQPKIEKQVMAQATKMAAPFNITAKSSTDTMGTKQPNMQHQMAPMFISMGQYLGLMIASVISIMTFMSVRFIGGKWKTFLGLQITGVITAFVLALITIGAMRTLVSFDGSTFNALLWRNSLYDLSVFELTSGLALLGGGLPSLLVQMPLFILQILAGGGTLPRAAMTSFYKFISQNTPMYQNIYNSFNAMAGLGNSGSLEQTLWWIVLAGLVFGGLAVAIGYRGTKRHGLAAVIPAKF